MANSNSVWVVAYINRDFITNVNEELEQYGYDNVEAYIPTVKMLRKQFKGKRLFEFVPLLFNYGFFRVPLVGACNHEYLIELRHRIGCIYAWVKDPAKDIANLQPRLSPTNKNISDAVPKAAVATDEEVAQMVRSSNSMGIFTQEDLKRFKDGDYIKLEGYPFEGMPAEILSINYRKKEVRVRLMIDELSRNISVSFENVFYSIYKNYKEEGKEDSIEELKYRHGNNVIDHITFKRKLV